MKTDILLADEQIANIQSQYVDANVPFEPVLNMAIEKYAPGIMPSVPVAIIEKIADYLLGQLDAYIESRTPKTRVGKIIKALFSIFK